MPEQVERDIRLFRGRTQQYVYISSASAYAKPVRSPYITEGTANYILAHPELQVEDPEFDQWCDKVIEAQEQAKKMIK